MSQMIRGRLGRRDLLRGAGALCAATTLPAAALATSRKSTLDDLGLESITIMEPLGRDFAGTMRAVAKIGYRDIETIGTLGVPAPLLARTLRENGMRSTSQHLTPDSYYPQMLAWSRGQATLPDTLAKLESVYDLDRIDAVLDEGIRAAHVLGQCYLVWSYIPKTSLQGTPGALSRLIAVLDQSGRRCRAEGLTLAFHNGTKGFTAIDGIKPYDLILKETDAALLKMELDVYWMTKMGSDPIDYLKAHPGRFPMIYLKDMTATGAIAALGRGTLNFKAILAAAAASGVTNAFFEYDLAPNSLADARAGFEHYAMLRA